MSDLIKNNEILINWNVSNEPIKQVYCSAWQIGNKYILKSGENLNWLKNNLSVIRALSEYNIPVATIVKTIDGLDYVLKDNTYYFLSEKIRGDHISDIYTDNYRTISYLIGQVIGRLHISFRECQEKIDCKDNNFYDEMIGWVSQTLRNKEVNTVPKDILSECISQLKDIYPKLPRQLIHRDIHLNNMMFEENILTGYIDFDLSQIDARIFDLCYMVLSFLIDNINNNDKTKKWVDIVDNVVKGYSSIIQLTVDEKKAMPIMMIAIEVLFVAYFTNENNKVCADGASEMLLWLWANKERIVL
ncbi:phosphotransferase [Clostridium sp.]|uniref:phosphotransferase n=1 Tax=Clostridium sp. TaxID=1506 RepID=UPI00260978A1|nr:phosphotransferase [Clostridium sp.]